MRVGDWIEVRSAEEILRTLDAQGCLDGMPFMPEMFRFCGQSFQVYKRAHKTCDYTTPVIRSRRIRGTVHLETRCGGEAHGGCQAGCLLYWKEAWLKPVNGDSRQQSPSRMGTRERADTSPQSHRACQEADVWLHTQVRDRGEEPRYLCQATQVAAASAELHWWDLRQYVEDYWSGNVTLWRVLTAVVYSMYYNLSQAGIGLGPPMRWLYDKLRWMWRGSRWPRTAGLIPEGSPTPTATLNLQQGELVRIKSHEEILRTVTTANVNRGMIWDAELVPYCGGTYKVLRRLSKSIDEKTGQMVVMKTPCIILDSVVCQARYSNSRMLCPKSMFPYWREIWLERVNSVSGDGFSQRGLTRIE